LPHHCGSIFAAVTSGPHFPMTTCARPAVRLESTLEASAGEFGGLYIP